jgi:sortase A
MKIKAIACLLFCAGIGLMSYPKLSELYYSHQQSVLMEAWYESFQAIDLPQDSADPAPERLPASDRVEPARPATAPDSVMDEPETALDAHPDQPARFKRSDNMEGMLRIDAIDLELPILKGVTEANLKTTVASIQGTGELGQTGNFAIAGHRNRKFGSIFNRLDELDVGDSIRVDNGRQQFEYIVTEKLYVKPEDVWVLQGNGRDREITLVTCHPIGKSTHRLIVKGKIPDNGAML